MKLTVMCLFLVAFCLVVSISYSAKTSSTTTTTTTTTATTSIFYATIITDKTIACGTHYSGGKITDASCCGSDLNSDYYWIHQPVCPSTGEFCWSASIYGTLISGFTGLFGSCIPDSAHRPGSWTFCVMDRDCPWDFPNTRTYCDNKANTDPTDDVIVSYKQCAKCNAICQCDPSFGRIDCPNEAPMITQCPNGCTPGGPIPQQCTQTVCRTGADCPAPGQCKQVNCVNSVCVESDVPAGTTCNDNNACTQNDVCTGGACGGTAKDCSSQSDQCNTGVCEPASGNCIKQPKTGQACNDNNICTTGEACNAAGQCAGGTSVPDGTVCENNKCIVGDVRTCLSGTCQSGTPKTCNDNNPCTTDTCNSVTGCVFTNVPNNPPVPCSDGKWCTVDGSGNENGVCSNGHCSDVQPRNCADTDLCTRDECNEGNPGFCNHILVLTCPAYPGVNSCTDPSDTNPMTKDYRTELPSSCIPGTGLCSVPSEPITHTCDKTCGSPCDGGTGSDDCECPADRCVGTDLYHYDTNGNCVVKSATTCGCDLTEGEDVNAPCHYTKTPNADECKQGKVREFQLAMKFPDVQYGIVEVTEDLNELKNGKANFTRGQRMIIDFNAAAKLIGKPDTETVACNGNLGPCAGSTVTYVIKEGDDCSGAQMPVSSPVSWDDVYLAWRDRARTDGRFKCDTWYCLESTIAKDVDGTNVHNTKTETFFVNCVPKLILNPMEKRYALGDGPDKLFDITIINPFESAKIFTVSFKPDDYLSTLGITFAGNVDVLSVNVPAFSQDDSKAVQMTIGATRAGNYYITVLATSDSISLSQTGLVSVVAESLSEFNIVQLFGLIGGAAILLLAMI